MPVLVNALLGALSVFRPAAPGVTPAFCLPTTGAMSVRTSALQVLATESGTFASQGWSVQASDLDKQLSRLEDENHLLNSPGSPPLSAVVYEDGKRLLRWTVKDGVCTKSAMPPPTPPSNDQRCLAPSGVAVPAWGGKGSLGPVATQAWEAVPVPSAQSNLTILAAAGGTTVEDLMLYRNSFFNGTESLVFDVRFEDWVSVCPTGHPLA